MTELMRRRRALMGVGDSSDPNILFEWKPSDGLSNIEIVTSSGNPHYDLMDDRIRLYALLSWAGQYIFPKKTITWDGDVTVEVEFLTPYGDNVNLYCYARFLDGLNAYAAVGSWTKKLEVNGGSVSVGKITSGRITLEFTRATGSVKGTYTRNNVIAGQATGSIGTQHQRHCIVGVDGNNATLYYDITHIIARKGVST